MEEIWKRAISGEKGVFFPIFRFIFYILSFLYYLAFLLFRRMQSIRQVELPCPIISIGNITLGGTGKTALTALIAKRLEAIGYKVAIICTGFGGKKRGKVEKETPEEVGDEAYLLARCIERGSVWAGRDRLGFAREALKEGAQVIILDDAMQYFKVKKNLEIVMLNALEPFGYGYLFPRGRLREPLSGLKRADVVILNNSELVNDKANILFSIGQFNSTAMVLEAKYVPLSLLAIPSGQKFPLEWLKGKKVMGVAGIGSPEGFQKTLEKLAGEVIFRSFPDHHHFSRGELIALQKEAEEKKCEAILITDKDSVKIERLVGQGLPLLLPFLVLCVELKLTSEEKLWRKIQELLNPRVLLP